jgi:hypothetical protein
VFACLAGAARCRRRWARRSSKRLYLILYELGISCHGACLSTNTL